MAPSKVRATSVLYMPRTPTPETEPPPLRRLYTQFEFPANIPIRQQGRESRASALSSNHAGEISHEPQHSKRSLSAIPLNFRSRKSEKALRNGDMYLRHRTVGGRDDAKDDGDGADDGRDDVDYGEADGRSTSRNLQSSQTRGRDGRALQRSIPGNDGEGLVGPIATCTL